MDSINKVNKICKSILKLTDEDFKAIINLANDQINYIHPFKGAKQSQINKTGKYNYHVLFALKNLRQTIIDYNPKS
jgi:hypothetical protein